LLCPWLEAEESGRSRSLVLRILAVRSGCLSPGLVVVGLALPQSDWELACRSLITPKILTDYRKAVPAGGRFP